MQTGELAKRLVHSHRVRLGMSPEQYGSEVVHCSGGTVRRVEKGYVPFLYNQRKFAKALQMELTELWGTPDMPEVPVIRERMEMAA